MRQIYIFLLLTADYGHEFNGNTLKIYMKDTFQNLDSFDLDDSLSSRETYKDLLSKGYSEYDWENDNWMKSVFKNLGILECDIKVFEG